MVKYQSFNLVNIYENLERYNEIQQKYLTSKTSLEKRKEKLYDEGNFQKWDTVEKLTTKPSKETAMDIMLPKETKELNTMRDHYALHNFQLFKEIRRMMKENSKMLRKNLDEVLKIELDIANREVELWTGLMGEVKDMATVVSNG
jgi:hypothetical protein